MHVVFFQDRSGIVFLRRAFLVRIFVFFLSNVEIWKYFENNHSVVFLLFLSSLSWKRAARNILSSKVFPLKLIPESR